MPCRRGFPPFSPAPAYVRLFLPVNDVNVEYLMKTLKSSCESSPELYIRKRIRSAYTCTNTRKEQIKPMKSTGDHVNKRAITVYIIRNVNCQTKTCQKKRKGWESWDSLYYMSYLVYLFIEFRMNTEWQTKKKKQKNAREFFFPNFLNELKFEVRDGNVYINNNASESRKAQKK